MNEKEVLTKLQIEKNSFLREQFDPTLFVRLSLYYRNSALHQLTFLLFSFTKFNLKYNSKYYLATTSWGNYKRIVTLYFF